MSTLALVLFGLTWALLLYLFNCAVAGKFKPINLRLALLYFWTVAMIGLFGEIVLDTAYNFIVGRPLWWYNILPIHNGYTSVYAIILWGLYGFHLYMFHDTLGTKWSITSTKHLTFIFAIEALILESLLTISAKLFLGTFMYYYTPPDLWHVTSIQNFPFYLICGYIILKTIKRFKLEPVFFTIMSFCLTMIIAFIT